ncbi:unnamed protein product, partial [Protopolystoma xenopodis]
MRPRIGSLDPLLLISFIDQIVSAFTVTSSHSTFSLTQDQRDSSIIDADLLNRDIRKRHSVSLVSTSDHFSELLSSTPSEAPTEISNKNNIDTSTPDFHIHLAKWAFDFLTELNLRLLNHPVLEPERAFRLLVCYAIRGHLACTTFLSTVLFLPGDDILVGEAVLFLHILPYLPDKAHSACWPPSVVRGLVHLAWPTQGPPASESFQLPVAVAFAFLRGPLPKLLHWL